MERLAGIASNAEEAIEALEYYWPQLEQVLSEDAMAQLEIVRTGLDFIDRNVKASVGGPDKLNRLIEEHDAEIKRPENIDYQRRAAIRDADALYEALLPFVENDEAIYGRGSVSSTQFEAAKAAVAMKRRLLEDPPEGFHGIAFGNLEGIKNLELKRLGQLAESSDSLPSVASAPNYEEQWCQHCGQAIDVGVECDVCERILATYEPGDEPTVIRKQGR